ncbi:hypothetical protein PoB_004696200 [Plakobranchus ocellatus]|uniref:Secreted protein n=1 Tax=Plakobranchus ocellatus TaxID=259542 RepID=A0AAV4BM34_9GAST|nr:hypothetical protein PoB_004696200 [Plakobranchus ocellatus]
MLINLLISLPAVSASLPSSLPHLTLSTLKVYQADKQISIHKTEILTLGRISTSSTHPRCAICAKKKKSLTIFIVSCTEIAVMTCRLITTAGSAASAPLRMSEAQEVNVNRRRISPPDLRLMTSALIVC